MRVVVLATLSGLALALAACDAPDPAAFHHNLRSDVMVGTHINGNVGSGEVNNNTDTHEVEQLQRNNSINNIPAPGGR